MDSETKIDTALCAFGRADTSDVPDDFMGGVWLRAGQMGEAVEARRRLALFAVVFVTGLGAGFVTMQSPAQAEAPAYQLVVGEDLSPASLLIPSQ
ncbi:MAG: hypothetical protein R3360_06235 [Alphaproteobacteria bacterium]|nr:hypothetical protein [Alphaproteobacteria bacterium]